MAAMILLGPGRRVAAAADDRQIRGGGGAPVMLLPPLLVRDHHDSQIWRYAAVGGLEVLSRCDDATTTSFVTSYLRRKLELAQVLPPQLQLRQSVPLAIILITPAVEKTMNEDLVKTMNTTAKTETSGYVTSEASSWQVYRLVRTLPQLTLSDAESTGMVCTLDASQRGPVQMSGEASAFFKGLVNDGTYDDMSFTIGRIGAILGGRVPPLPPWFKSGFLAFYQEINWTLHSDTIRANPVFWISNALTKQMRRPEEAHLGLLPLAKFFAGPLGGATPLTLDESRLWSAQASLFFHWAYADPQRRDALWKLADLSSRRPVDEEMMQQCFGLDSGRLETALLAYLPKAVKSPQTLIKTDSIKIPEFHLQNASYVDAARIKGDMGRKEITYVKDVDPLSVAQYVEQVGAVLRGPTEDSERDPAQLAVLGLYDCDVGKNDEALPLLEVAATAHVARPTLYVELAKIRYGKALDQLAGTEGKLGSEQVAALLGLLRESRRYPPAQADAYELAATIWSRAETSPSHENLAWLEEGVELFPGDLDLVTATSKLCVQEGYALEAIKLVDRVLACTDAHSGMRNRLMEVRAQAMAPAAP